MPSNFAVTPTSTTTLPANSFPVSAVFVPGTASGNLTALQGGPASTDGNSYTSAPMAIYVADGSDVTLGTTTDLSSANTLIGLTKAIKANTTSVVIGSGTVTANQGGSWAVTANAGTNLNTSALALESGGNLASILAALDDGQETMANSLSVAIASDQSAVPVSGTITANIGTAGSLALDTSVQELNVALEELTQAQGSTTSGQVGPLIQGAVTTGSPTYTTAQTSPLSLTTAGALRVDASATTQPISAASLPLPSGAALDSTLQSILTDTADIETSVANIPPLGQALAAASVPVVLTAAQLTTLTPPAAITGFALDTSVNGILLAQASTTSGQKGPLMLGAVTTNAPSYTTAQSDPLSLDASGLLRVSIKDTPSNTNNFNVNIAASAITQAVSGTVTANQGGAPWQENITQFGGNNVVTGTGAGGSGIPRVTVSNDSNVLATQSGTWTVQPGNTPNSTAWLVQDVAGTSGGATTNHLVSASGTNATNVKASAGLLYGFSITNTNAAARYVHFYNKASAPTVGTDVPVATVGIPGNGLVIRAFPVGATYGTGISFGTSTGAADNDSGSVGAGDLVVDLEYK